MRFSEILLFLGSYTRAAMRLVPFLIVLVGFGGTFGALMMFMEDISPRALARPDKVKVAFRGDAEKLKPAFDSTNFEVVKDDTTPADILVTNHIVHAVIEAPQDLSQTISSQPTDWPTKQPTIGIRYDPGDVSSGSTLSRITEALGSAREVIRKDRLVLAGLATRWQVNTHIIKGIDDNGKDSGSQSAKDTDRQYSAAKSISMWLTLFISWLVISHAVSMVVDEHEKGTLILLILSPTSKANFILANFAHCVLLTMAVVYPAYLFVGWLMNAKIVPVGPAQVQALAHGIQPGVWLGLLCTIPLIAVCAAAGVLLSTFCRDMKQVGIAAGVAAGVAGAFAANVYGTNNAAGALLGLSPIGGSARTICDALCGNADWALIGVTFASAFVYSAIMLAIAVQRAASGKVLDAVVTAK